MSITSAENLQYEQLIYTQRQMQKKKFKGQTGLISLTKARALSKTKTFLHLWVEMQNVSSFFMQKTPFLTFPSQTVSRTYFFL